MTTGPEVAPARSRTRKARTGRPVEVRRAHHPARKIYRQITAKRDPLDLEQLEDGALLRWLVGEQAAGSVAEKLAPVGGLGQFHQLGGPRALLDLPGVDEGTALKLLCLYEVAARIAAPHIEAAREGGAA